MLANFHYSWHSKLITAFLTIIHQKIIMPDISTLFAFALVALTMALIPGPNMLYLISRSICQGRVAGLTSLAGVAVGFLPYMFAAAFGITALFSVVPLAYDALRLAGVAYLLYLAWQALKPGGRSPFQVRELQADKPRKLFVMGFMTNLFNPKAAMLYLSLLPQFAHPQNGSILTQSLALGFLQIAVSVAINGIIAISAVCLASRPLWATIQRWLMGTVLAGLAIQMLLDCRK
jgi:threonine/homoserine/homoserine lactone efflux protein